MIPQQVLKLTQELDAVAGTPIGFTDCPRVLKGVAGAYAVRVTGDCMQPVYAPGSLVYVHPSRRPAYGQDVVIYRKGETEGLIKRYVGRGYDELVLFQFNPGTTIRIPLKEVAMCNLVVGVSHED
jgi:phage repressor protein C with HTH and peptisase S24 domain